MYLDHIEPSLRGRKTFIKVAEDSQDSEEQALVLSMTS